MQRPIVKALHSKLRNLTISLPIFVIMVCFNLQHAEARIEGTVRGRMTVGNNRFSVNGTGPANPLPIVPVRRVIVSVRSIPANSTGELNVINPTSFGVTDANGNFELPWLDNTRDNFPTSLRVTVWFESSTQVGATGNTRPSSLFRVVSVVLGGEASADQSFVRNVNSAAPNLGSLNAIANDETAAYLTSDEFFHNIVRGSSVLPDRMPGLRVKTRVPNFNFSFGVTPLRREVFVSASTPRTSPMTVAHELGHALTWSALDLELAPIVPITDYVFPPGGLSPSWQRTTREFSKAAFLEGLADTWAVVWAFGSNANASFTRSGLTFNVESATVKGSGGQVVLDCKTVNNAHEFPFCHTAALMDLLDSDGANGDGVNMSIATIVSTLNRFDNCIGNGCLHELGVDALNHHDFRCNASGANRRALIRKVWQLNGINGGPTSSCSS